MTWRYRFVFFGLVFVFFLVVARLFYWQVVKASELSLLGQQQYGTTMTVMPRRGEIETADGFPIAANRISYLVFANPKEITNKNAIATILASTLQLDIASVSANLALDKFWVPIKSGVDSKIKLQLEQMNLPGIGFDNQYNRFYPEASMAAQLLGFVGKDNAGNDKGYFGLEGFYDRLLSGKEGLAVEVNDAFGKPILAEMNQSAGVTDGANLTLNIDRSSQFLVEQKLKDGVEQYG